MTDYVFNEHLNRPVIKGSFMDQPLTSFVKYCAECTRVVDAEDMPAMISLLPVARTKDRNKRQIHCLDCRASEGFAESDITDPPF